jgi:replicative DNA helicase
METNLSTAEKKFLAYLFSDKLYIAKAMSRMDISYFKNIKSIYQLFVGYYTKYRGVIPDDVLSERLTRKYGKDDVIQQEVMISASKGFSIQGTESEFHASMDDIIEQYKRDKLISVAELVLAKSPRKCDVDDLQTIQDDINKILVDIDRTNYDIEREGTIEEDSEDRLKEYQHIKEHPEDVQLFKTGFKHIDESIIGWNYGSLNIVCGRKGDGKSVALLNLGFHLWKQKLNVLFFSLEIDKKQYSRRWDARAALVSSKGLKAGTLTAEEEETYIEYINNMKQKKDMFGNDVGSVYIVDCPSNVTPAFIASKTEEIERNKNIKYDVVIVDYMGIMSPNIVTGVLRDDLGQISLDLKRFAREHKCMVFTAVQMNRAGRSEIESKKGSSSAAVAGSDSILDHADNAFTVYSMDDSMASIDSIKTRDGNTFSFRAQKNYDKMQMIEVDDAEWDNI